MDWIEELNIIDRENFIRKVNLNNHRHNYVNIGENDMWLFCNEFIHNFNKKIVYFSIITPGDDRVINVKKTYDNIYELIHDFEVYYSKLYSVIIVSRLNGNDNKINIDYTFFTNHKLD